MSVAPAFYIAAAIAVLASIAWALVHGGQS